MITARASAHFSCADSSTASPFSENSATWLKRRELAWEIESSSTASPWSRDNSVERDRAADCDNRLLCRLLRQLPREESTDAPERSPPQRQSYTWNWH